MAALSHGVNPTKSNPHPLHLNWRERVESVKAGIIGAIATGLCFAGLRLLEPFLSGLVSGLAPMHGQNALSGWVSWAIATVSGGLFGITYRYVIRCDHNPHLSSGAVLAFGLVRGLAAIDVEITAQARLEVLIVSGIESLLLFTIARYGLDWTLKQGWVQRFPALEVAVPAANDGDAPNRG